MTRDRDLSGWEMRSRAAHRATATKRKKYKKWPAHRGPRDLKPLVRIEEWPTATSVGDILCTVPDCRGRLVTTSETVSSSGGGAAQLFRMHYETKTCNACKARFQVLTVTPESQS